MFRWASQSYRRVVNEKYFSNAKTGASWHLLMFDCTNSAVEHKKVFQAAIFFTSSCSCLRGSQLLAAAFQAVVL